MSIITTKKLPIWVLFGFFALTTLLSYLAFDVPLRKYLNSREKLRSLASVSHENHGYKKPSGALELELEFVDESVTGASGTSHLRAHVRSLIAVNQVSLSWKLGPSLHLVNGDLATSIGHMEAQEELTFDLSVSGSRENTQESIEAQVTTIEGGYKVGATQMVHPFDSQRSVEQMAADKKARLFQAQSPEGVSQKVFE